LLVGGLCILAPRPDSFVPALPLVCRGEAPPQGLVVELFIAFSEWVAARRRGAFGVRAPLTIWAGRMPGSITQDELDQSRLGRPGLDAEDGLRRGIVLCQPASRVRAGLPLDPGPGLAGATRPFKYRRLCAPGLFPLRHQFIGQFQRLCADLK